MITFAAFSCTHCPLQDEEAVKWLESELKTFKPNYLVHLGDLFEADSASRWPSEYDWTLEDEYREASQLLCRLRSATPKSKCIFLPGNHDDNLLSVGRIAGKVRSLCNWKARQYDDEGNWLNQELLENWQIGCQYRYCRSRGVYRLGQVNLFHGYESGSNAEEFQSILLGSPYTLSVCGHTHRPLPVTQSLRTKQVPLPYWYANPGCIRDIVDVPYMYRKRQHNWGQGLVIGETIKSTAPKRSVNWSAETKIFRMYA